MANNSNNKFHLSTYNHRNSRSTNNKKSKKCEKYEHSIVFIFCYNIFLAIITKKNI